MTDTTTGQAIDSNELAKKLGASIDETNNRLNSEFSPYSGSRSNILLLAQAEKTAQAPVASTEKTTPAAASADAKAALTADDKLVQDKLAKLVPTGSTVSFKFDKDLHAIINATFPQDAAHKAQYNQFMATLNAKTKTGEDLRDAVNREIEKRGELLINAKGIKVADPLEKKIDALPVSEKAAALQARLAKFVPEGAAITISEVTVLKGPKPGHKVKEEQFKMSRATRPTDQEDTKAFNRFMSELQQNHDLQEQIEAVVKANKSLRITSEAKKVEAPTPAQQDAAPQAPSDKTN